MCRLFGFRSVIQSQVHSSLIEADNALAVQSEMHPDGWGVAYYVDGAPHLTKSASSALDDALFRRVSGIVASETVIAHIRKATVGHNSVLNTHPFQYGSWVFAHNGDIPDFDRCRAAVEAEIAPRLRRYILGDTDSERIFFLFLTILSGYGPLSSRLGVAEVMEALAQTTRLIRSIADGPDAPGPSLLNLLVTNGMCLAAIKEGKDLYWSSYKTRCPDRDTCPHLADVCEAPTTTGFINHLIISSEPLGGKNVWLPMKEGEIIGVDWRMRMEQRMAASA
jgi:predicted glutamine amidotransferase